MMSDPPFVFEAGPIKLSTLAHKIDYDEYKVLEEYAGPDYVHRIRLTRPGERFDPMNLFYMNNGECWPYHTQPASRLARCKLINKCRRQYGYRKSWDDYAKN